MKIFTSAFIFCTLILARPAAAQVNQQSGWLASFNTIKLDKKWSIHAEFQLRSSDEWKKVQTILPRVGLNYHLKPNQIITAGYAFIPNRVAAFGKAALLGEHRAWQQYIYNQKLTGMVVTHRLRLEERFVPVAGLEGNELVTGKRNYSTRLRYFARAVIPFRRQQPFEKGLFGALQEELFFNVSHKKNVNGRFFDQNRAYVAIGYRVNKKFDIETGYLNQFVERRAGQENIMNHIIQLAFYTRL